MSGEVTQIFDVTHSSVLLLLTPMSPSSEVQTGLTSHAGRSPSRTYKTPFARAALARRAESSTVALSFAVGAVTLLEPLRPCPVPLCPSSAQAIQLWVGFPTPKGDAHFAQGVIKL